MKKHTLVNPYSDEVALLSDCTEAHFVSFIRKNYPAYRGIVSPPSDGRSENPVKNGVTHFYLWINPNNTKAGKRLTVIHETGHLVVGLFYDVGIPITGNKDYESENPPKAVDEAFTYLQESFCKQIFRILKL